MENYKKNIVNEEWTDYWNDVRHSFMERWIHTYKSKYGYKKFAFDVSKIWEKGSILEVGAGLAYISRILAKKQKGSIYSLDYNSNVCQKAFLISKSEGNRISFIQGDIYNLPFCDKSIEIVMSTGLLEHFDIGQLKSIIGEMKRVSKIVVANLPQKHVFWNYFWKIRRMLKSRLDPNQRLYSKTDMNNLFKSLGYSEIYIKSKYFGGIFPYMCIVAR